MRSAHTFMILCSTLAACYDGRAESSFPLNLSDTGGGESSSGGADDGPQGDESSSDAGDESSGGAGDESTGEPAGPAGPDSLAPCELCGCYAWSAGVTDGSAVTSATLTALQDGGVLVALTSDSALTLRRLSAAGAPVWSRVFPGQVANARAAAIGEDFMVIAGTLRGTLELTEDVSGTLHSAGGDDGFAALLSDFGEGAMIWGRSFGDAADQRVSDLAVTGCEAGLTKDCRLQLAGVHGGELGLGPAGVGGTHVFHALLDAVYWIPGEASVWRAASELATADELPTLAPGSDGSVTLVATVRDGLDLGDVIARRIGPDEQEVWDLRFTAPGQQRATSAAHAGDRLWLGGYVHARTDLGAGPFGADGQQTAFIAALDGDGLATTSRAVGGWLPTRQALAATVDGRVTVTGYTNGDIDLGGGSLSYRGARDVMLARYGSAGEYLCGALYGDVDVQEGLATASLGERSFVLARVSGAIDFGDSWRVSESEELVLAAFTR